MRFFSAWHEKALRGGTAYNTLDAMKLFAIVNMTVDHVGAYLFPDLLWLRAIGRITFPVWFFLVGYSRSREIGRELWTYALLLALLHPFIATPVFALNALATVILCRHVLNFCTDHALIPNRVPEVMAVFFFLSLVTLPLFEYGSIAFMFALMGRMVRAGGQKHLRLVAFGSYASFILWQFILFDFDLSQNIYVAAGTAWVVWWLARCPIKTIWQDWRQTRFRSFIAVLSRNTLPYYFYHRAVLQIIGAMLIGKGLGFSLSWINFFGKK